MNITVSINATTPTDY